MWHCQPRGPQAARLTKEQTDPVQSVARILLLSKRQQELESKTDPIHPIQGSEGTPLRLSPLGQQAARRLRFRLPLPCLQAGQLELFPSLHPSAPHCRR